MPDFARWIRDVQQAADRIQHGHKALDLSLMQRLYETGFDPEGAARKLVTGHEGT